MFDISWSELLVIGVVALIVVGPKELPTLLRTVGKYVGMIKRQAGEFRAQFDEAMRESELDQLKKDVENIKTNAESTFRDVERSVESEVSGMRREFDSVAHGAADKPYDAAAMHDGNGVPFQNNDAGNHGGSGALAAPGASGSAASGSVGAGAAAVAAAAAAAPPPSGPAEVKPGPSGSPPTNVGA